MSPRTKRVYNLLKKYGELIVREICNKSDMRNQTVEKCLDELYDLGKVSFYERGNRKCYFIKRKGMMNFHEIQEGFKENLGRIRKMVKQATLLYQNQPNSSSISLLVSIGELLLHELAIIEIYKTGVEERNYLNRWKRQETLLKKLLLELMNVDVIRISTSLQTIQSVKTSLLSSRIEKRIKGFHFSTSLEVR